MPPASNRTQRKRPGDLTGVRGQALAAAAELEKEETTRQVDEALHTERKRKASTEVDYSTKARTIVHAPKEVFVEVPGEAVDGEVQYKAEIVIEDIEVEVPTRRIRVNYPIEDMTFGKEVVTPAEYDEHGGLVKPAIMGGLRSYEFEEGRWYTVDVELAEHLAHLGYIYEM
jgi:hypothetical protein